jgi:glycosyltransferase involved in cell wall biosynthesis
MRSVKQFREDFFKIEEEVDVVHGHHIKAMALFLGSNLKAKRKSLYTVHGSYLFLSKINAMLLKFIFKASDKIIFVNQMLYDVLPQSYKDLIVGKYEVILNGVESNYDYKRSDVYEKFNIDKEDTVCFHPARFVTEKNHIRLISAFKPLIEQNSKIKLYLAGDGKLKKEIVDHIALLNLQENVILLGLIDRDEVYNFLERCDLFLMPSISEGLNIAFLEAISMKTKIVVSDIEQFTYPLKAYGLEPKFLNVTFVDPEDEVAMSQGIFYALQEEQVTGYDGGDFSLGSMMEKYESIYSSLLSEKVEG